MEINEELKLLRLLRKFRVKAYIANKVDAINEFFREENLDAAVVGLSGGIDSTVVLALLNKAKEQPNSPIKKVLGVIVPFLNRDAATGQHIGVNNAINYVDDCTNSDWILVNGIQAFDSIVEQCQVTSAWARGQMLCILRTPIFYYQAAILQEQGYKSIVIGTTNKTEYSIGFYGKASDGANDLQPIIDIYKSEVYAVARLLDIPEELINQRPEGGVWDGKGDEEMIGATYDEVEHFLLAKEYNCAISNSKSVENILTIQNKNLHKTKVGLPSRQINVL